MKEQSTKRAWYHGILALYDTRRKRITAVAATLISLALTRTSTAYGTMPFGVALLAAGGGADLPPLLLGSICGVFLGNGDRVSLLSAAFLTILVRLWVCSARGCAWFAERRSARVLAAASGASLFSLYRLAAGGFRRYDVWGLAVGVTLSVLFGFAFSLIHASGRGERATGGGALLLAVCYAARSLSLFSFSPALTIAAGMTALAAELWGAPAAVFCGLFGGLAGAGESAAVALAVGGLAAAVAKRILPRGSAALVAVVGGGYLAATSDIFAGVAMLGSATPGVLAVAFFIQKTASLVVKNEETEDSCFTKGEMEVASSLSTALGRLSETLTALSRRFTTPAAREIVEGCMDECRARCRGCMYEGGCYGVDATPISSVFASAVEDLQTDARTAEAKFARRVPPGCPQQTALIALLRGTLASAQQRAAAEDRVSVCAQTYARMAGLYRASLVDRGDNEPNSESAKTLRAFLSRVSPETELLSAVGTRAPRFRFAVPADWKLTGTRAVTLHRRLTETLGFPLAAFTEERAGVWRTERAPAYRVHLSVCATPKHADVVSGDLLCDFVSVDHYYYALLCDGMGSGREAALRARICKVFARELLSVGCDARAALAAISDVLRYTPGECFSTVDLLVVDLYDGNGVFYKNGAAASYVLRADNLYRIASRSLPLGICEEIATERTAFSFGAGDVVLLLSDGIAENGEDEWLSELLAEDRGETAPALLSRIVGQALRRGEHADDRTIGAVEIFAAS